MEIEIPSQLLTVTLFVERHPFISEAGLRYLIYRSRPRRLKGKDLPDNGFSPALHRIGRRIYIDPTTFFRIIAEGKSGGGQ